MNLTLSKRQAGSYMCSVDRYFDPQVYEAIKKRLEEVKRRGHDAQCVYVDLIFRQMHLITLLAR